MTEAQLRLIHDAMDEVVVVLGKSGADITTLTKARAALTEIEQLVSEQLQGGSGGSVTDDEYKQANVFPSGPREF